MQCPVTFFRFGSNLLSFGLYQMSVVNHVLTSCCYPIYMGREQDSLELPVVCIRHLLAPGWDGRDCFLGAF